MAGLNALADRLRSVGPGALAAAAFVGPGTVATATIAGAQYGYSLVWTLVFATLAAVTLHEMAVRLGVGARLGLGQAITAELRDRPFLRAAATALVLAALAIGNAAYEGGNIAGAALGVSAAGLEGAENAVVLAITALAGALLFLAGHRLIERVLITIVGLMSVCFLLAAMLVQPDPAAIARGLIPSVPPGGALLVIGLIGTTIVPYNLFLHAAAAKERWTEHADRRAALLEARFDARLSIGVGGFISLLIMTTAAASVFEAIDPVNVRSGADLAVSLEPAFGALARYVIAIGLFAAGLSSAVTAPLATAYAAGELFDFGRARAFKAVAGAVLFIGAASALSDVEPIEIILFAQAANGALLPIVGGFLLYAANRRALLGANVNGVLANIAGGLVLLVTMAISARAFATLLASL